MVITPALLPRVWHSMPPLAIVLPATSAPWATTTLPLATTLELAIATLQLTSPLTSTLALVMYFDSRLPPTRTEPRSLATMLPATLRSLAARTSAASMAPPTVIEP